MQTIAIIILILLAIVIGLLAFVFAAQILYAIFLIFVGIPLAILEKLFKK